ncbi:MAG TPA: response regulator [Verrucomicrobiae bacterium]|nr:response regulator [Verrucomicrobiae bacterium]
MKNVLIIEDDPKIAAALEIRFQSGGYGTQTARDAALGFSKAVASQPDLIVLDITLPGGNGFDLAARFRTLPETQRAPIIFVTASKTPDLRQRAMALGAAGLFEKPYDSAELLAVAGHALGETGMFKRPIARFNGGTDRFTPEKTNKPLKRVLVIEDDHKLALGLAVRLKSAGYEASMAHDALSGVNAALQYRPDLVLLDIAMPAGDGFVVAERMRKLLSTSTPIIFLTGTAQPGSREKAMAMGACAFFEKPVEPGELLAVVEREIGRTAGL